jgi:hypothetical protein
MAKFRLILIALLLCALSGSGVEAKAPKEFDCPLLLKFSLSEGNGEFSVVTIKEAFSLSSEFVEEFNETTQANSTSSVHTIVTLGGTIKELKDGRYRISIVGSYQFKETTGEETKDAKSGGSKKSSVNFDVGTILIPDQRQMVASHHYQNLYVELEFAKISR